MAQHSGVQRLTPKADPAPDSHTQCCHKEIGEVCRAVQGAGLLNPATKGQGQVEEEGAREACTALVAVAGSEFVVVAVFFAAAGSSVAAGSGSVVAAAEVSAVAAAGSGSSAAESAVACAGAAGPEPQPHSQSGQIAHGLDFLPAFGPGPGPAASSAVAGGTENHM